MEWWHVYLWTRLDALRAVSFIITGVYMIAFVISCICWAVNLGQYLEEERAKAIQAIKVTWFAWLMLLVVIWIPSSKDFALIYVLPKVAESKVIQQDVPEIYDMAMDKLKDMLDTKDKD